MAQPNSTTHQLAASAPSFCDSDAFCLVLRHRRMYPGAWLRAVSLDRLCIVVRVTHKCPRIGSRSRPRAQVVNPQAVRGLLGDQFAFDRNRLVSSISCARDHQVLVSSLGCIAFGKALGPGATFCHYEYLSSVSISKSATLRFAHPCPTSLPLAHTPPVPVVPETLSRRTRNDELGIKKRLGKPDSQPTRVGETPKIKNQCISFLPTIRSQYMFRPGPPLLV